MGPSARRLCHSLATIAAAGFCVSLWLAGAAATHAFATECEVFVDGQSVDDAASPETAIRVRSDQSANLLVRADDDIQSASLAIHFGPLPIIPLAPTVHPQREWSGTVSVAEYATFGAGYYQVVGNIDACAVSAWVFIESPAPLLTAASLIALIVLAIGALTGGAGLVAGARHRGGLPRAVLGGVLVGGSALVLAQQTGVAPADTTNVITWTTLPGAGAGVGHALLGAVVAPRRRREAEMDAAPYDYPPPYPPPADTPTPPFSLPSRPTGSAPPVGSPPPVGSAPPADTPPPRYGEPETAAAPPPTAAASVQPDPPRESYAHLDCPEAVVAEEEFELAVGLASLPDRAVVGGPLVRPDHSIGPYTITIQVIADGFRLTRPQESWRVDLPVTAAAPYPTTVLHLAAEPETRPVVARTIRALFSVNGQAIGLAARPIAVVSDAAQLERAPTTSAATEPLDIGLPTDETPPDLTVRIDVGQPAGRLLLQLLAPDPDVTMPRDPLVVDIGNEPGLFLRDVIRKMNSAEGQPGMYRVLMGIGLTIADQLPTEFWNVVADVAERVDGRPPTILFLSAEPYVPWELAVMEEPLDSSLPPFLSAQASVGRWVLGQRRPKLPPPANLTVRSMAVVSGVYGLPGWERLLDAEQEADELAARYGAQRVNAASQDVLRLVGGEPAADLLHFAVHGQYDPNGEIDGIVLVDGLTLDPMQIRGSPLHARPFVFLNACQVGSGQAVLGDYSGMAEAFLFAGASGVIAPLWSIDDVMAREIALRFYEQALTGRTPAEILRQERAAFRDDPTTVSSTYLAYQYFGHPHMTLDRTDG